MGRAKHKYKNHDGSRFVLLPHVVMDSPAYLNLSFSATTMLVDVARQYSGSNNGKLVLCDKALKRRGWNSHATITKAKRELIEAGLLFLTRQGYRPNKASWYALTWLSLDWTPEMEISLAAFPRGAYLENKSRPSENGARGKTIAPNSGVSPHPATPETGAIR